MNKLITIRGAQITLAAVAVAFFVIHIAMCAVFWINGVMPMAYFNIFSIVFYAFSLYLVYREKMLAFCVAVYLEVVAHMTLAVFFTGWDSGFQITIIGMYILLFFAEYVGRCLQVRYVHALPWGALGMCMYLGVFFLGNVYPPQYTLPVEVSQAFQVTWGLIVFLVGMACLQAFVLLTFRSEAMLTTEAWHDKLTGLPNRYYMSDRLEKLIEGKGGKTRWVAIADLDDFKTINDTYGHNCGDEVLCALASILATNPAGGEVCRWGGEEFLMAGVTDDDLSVVAAQLERLRKAVEGHGFWHHEQRLRMTITIGLARYEEGQSAIEWINKADENLYKGKKSGKNQVVV